MAATYLDPAPRDFTQSPDLTEQRILRTLEMGRPGSAMQSFAQTLSAVEMAAVARYVMDSFVECGGHNTRYHTEANGWPDHEDRYGAAYPYVLGGAASDLDPQGEDLFRRGCSTCHEPAPDILAETAPLSFEPVLSVGTGAQDQSDGASHGHGEAPGYGEYGAGDRDADRPPILTDPSPSAIRGQALYLRDCALCHAADGSGRNDIGRFLDPSPPDFTDPSVAASLSLDHVREATRSGLPGTSMPAFGGVLQESDIEDLIAYLGRVHEFR